MEKFREYLFLFMMFVTLVIAGFGYVYMKTSGYESTNTYNYKNKHTKSVPYTSPISTQQEKILELQRQKNYHYLTRPIAPVRQAVEPTPDDAYEEGYEEGYEQGMYDGQNGYNRGRGYDDSSDYYNYYEKRYQEGYEEGYEDGYRLGREEYETRIEEEEDDWFW